MSLEYRMTIAKISPSGGPRIVLLLCSAAVEETVEADVVETLTVLVVVAGQLVGWTDEATTTPLLA